MAQNTAPPCRDYQTFSEWLLAATAKRGQKVDLARAVDKSSQDVNGWTAGKRPSAGVLKEIAKYYGIEYLELVRFWEPWVGLPGKSAGNSSRSELLAGRKVPVRGDLCPTKEGGHWMDAANKNNAGYVRWADSAPRTYSYRVLGDELYPRVYGGEFLIIDPDQPCSPGDEVLVALANRIAVLRLLARSPGIVSCQEIGGERRSVTLSEADILEMHAVVGIAKPGRWSAD